MKRHPVLVALDHDHHELSSRDACSPPRAATPTTGSRQALPTSMPSSGTPSSTSVARRRPSSRSMPVSRPRTRELLDRVLREHMEGLHGLARALRAEVASGEASGVTLEEASVRCCRAHVRLEERELFEDVQRVVPPAELDQLE